MSVGRFAPSPTGPAHPGTFLSGLLAWLDARSNGARFVLRLEDIDQQRSKAAYASAMVEDLAWLGLDWDELVVQSERRDAHYQALDQLAERDLLYGCTCSRATLRATAAVASDGSRLYPGTCRGRVLGSQNWRDFDGTVRYRVADITTTVRQIQGPDRVMRPAVEMGDPVVRRKDGAVTYNLAVVVDDIEKRVTRVVRGNDILPSTGIHAALYRDFSQPTPAYWHHPLLLEERLSRGDGTKLSKLNGS
ncbi:MAG: glutamyl-Q tRNA(Asp) synthetase, partial [Myxococcota bacterium]